MWNKNNNDLLEDKLLKGNLVIERKDMMSVKDLLKEIEYCRNEMVYLASQSSLSNENVIAVSTKLDDLLNKYDDITAKKQ